MRIGGKAEGVLWETRKPALVSIVSAICVWIAYLSGSAAAQEKAPTDTAAAVSCLVEMVPMRDGVKLATEVYRPAGAGTYPVIMLRSPYNGYVYSHTELHASAPSCKNAAMLAMAARGYVVINQDVRGTFRSEGKFVPVIHESDDGYDAIEWAARQPWSTGKVGMMGGSYLAVTQWQAAIKRPPHLVTIVPSVGPVSFDSGWPYQRPRVLHQFLAQVWTAYETQDLMYRQLAAAHLPEAEINAKLAAHRQRSNEALLAPSTQGLPLASNPVFNTELAPWYHDWLSHPTLDSYWEPSNVEDKFETLSIPVLSLGGFHDLFAFGTVDGFTGMQQHAATSQARDSARLIMAGGGHIQGKDGYIGDITFGADNQIPYEATARWFDYWLKGIDNGVMNDPPVKLFVMLPPDVGSVGSGFWVSGSSFPLAGTETARYFLGGSHANTLAGGGILSVTPVGSGGSDQFQYDPANPVPTNGGNACCGDLLPGGAFDQRSVELRPDVLVYTSEALTKAVPVIGNISVTLTASSSAPRTTFTAKLVDVHPDGYAQNISDGIVAADLASANSAATYTIRMNPTATVFKAGHKIRLEISSSNYPRFPVTTDPLAKAKDLTVATQTIMWKGTSLNLPVAPTSILPKQLTEAAPSRSVALTAAGAR